MGGLDFFFFFKKTTAVGWRHVTGLLCGSRKRQKCVVEWVTDELLFFSSCREICFFEVGDLTKKW